MKNTILILLAFVSVLMVSSCQKDEVIKNETSIIPAEFQDRTNEVIGELEIDSRDVTISLWDHGLVDGDIVSIYVNGKLTAEEITLEGPSNKYVFDTQLEYNGYNYILMFAHNTGSVYPNTAAISIDDGLVLKEFQVESSLSTNGTWDIVVR